MTKKTTADGWREEFDELLYQYLKRFLKSVDEINEGFGPDPETNDKWNRKLIDFIESKISEARREAQIELLKELINERYYIVDQNLDEIGIVCTDKFETKLKELKSHQTT